MNEPKWIVVRNWNEYQHPDVLRTKGPPAWIKLSTSIQHDEGFLAMPWRRRAILLQLFVEYGMSHGQLTNDTRTLSRRLHGRVMNADLQTFIEAGFITLSASKPASRHASNLASLEKRREEEKGKHLLATATPSPNGQGHNCTLCAGGLTFHSRTRLLEHLHVVHDQEPTT